MEKLSLFKLMSSLIMMPSNVFVFYFEMSKNSTKPKIPRTKRIAKAKDNRSMIKKIIRPTELCFATGPAGAAPGA